MRKYWRLILILITLISCIFMLIYRIKYEYINSVLELMSIFKSNVQNNFSCPSKKLALYDHFFIKDQLVHVNDWIHAYDGMWIYSSYFIYKRVITLGYSSVPIKNFKDLSCMLWYENHDQSMKSTLNFYSLEGQKQTLFYAICTPLFDYGVPYAVTYIKNNHSISLPIKKGNSYNMTSSACVKPLSPVFDDVNRISEFLIYHSHVGIKHFILYYNVLSPSVQRLLVRLAAECDIHVELLPWNMPSITQHRKSMMEPYVMNCIFHVSTQNYSKSLFTLDLNRYIFMEPDKDITYFISENSNVDVSKFWERKFCLEYPDNVFAKSLNIHFKTLAKTNMLHNVSHYSHLNLFNVKKLLSVMQINEGFKKWLLKPSLQRFNFIQESSAIVFAYVPCDLSSVPKNASFFTKNDEMWSYKNIFYQSCLYKLAKSNNLIKD